MHEATLEDEVFCLRYELRLLSCVLLKGKLERWVEGAIFVPIVHLRNTEETQLFLAIDLEKQWICRPRRCGLYRSTAWIPGNFLNIGMHYASVAMSRLDTNRLHLFELQVVAFNVVESSGEDTARGIYAGNLPGTIRSILEWETFTIGPSGVAEMLPAGRQE